MNKFLILILLFFSLTPLFSQSVVSLEQAIRFSAGDIAARLEAGVTIAVVDFSSDSVSMSDHVIGELNNALVNERSLTVVGRGAELELVRREVGLGLTMEVSDASAQRIGHFLGARMVVSGSMSIIGADYRFRIQVLEVETAAIRYSQTFNVLNDRQVRILMGENALVVNFTPGERAGAAALNLAFGVGSFVIQKDPMGGAIAAILEGIGVAAIAVSPLLVKETQKVDPWSGLWYTERDTSLSAPVFYAGVAAYAVGAVYGVYRALSYQKPGINAASAGSLPWNIALVDGSHGNVGVRLNYTLRF